MADSYRTGKNRLLEMNNWDAGAQVTACRNVWVTENLLRNRKQETKMERESKWE